MIRPFAWYHHLPRMGNMLLSGIDRLWPRARLWSKPLRIEIDINNYCNLRCPHCLRQSPSAHLNDSILHAGDLRRLAGWFRSGLTVRLGGTGEPFVQKDLFEIIDLVRSGGAAVSIVSNCTLIDDAAARRLCEPAPLMLNMSIDAATPAVFERVREGAKFDEVTANIDRLAALKRETGSPFPVLNINMTLMRDTMGELPGVIALARRWGVSVIVAQTVIYFDPAVDRSQAITNQEAREAVENARPLAEAAGIDLRFVPLASEPENRGRVGTRDRTTPKRFFCPYLWYHLWVDVEGGIMACCMADFGRFGRLQESDPSRLWNHPGLVELRGRILRGDLPPACESCCMLEPYSRRRMLNSLRVDFAALFQML